MFLIRELGGETCINEQQDLTVQCLRRESIICSLLEEKKLEEEKEKKVPGSFTLYQQLPMPR